MIARNFLDYILINGLSSNSVMRFCHTVGLLFHPMGHSYLSFVAKSLQDQRCGFRSLKQVRSILYLMTVMNATVCTALLR